MLISNEKGNDKTHRLQMSVTRQDKTRRVAYVSPVNMAVLQEEIKEKTDDRQNISVSAEKEDSLNRD